MKNQVYLFLSFMFPLNFQQLLAEIPNNNDAVPFPEWLKELQTHEIETIAKIPVISTVDFLKAQVPFYALSAQDEVFAREQIKKGHAYINSLASHQAHVIPVPLNGQFQDIQKDYLNAIISIAWALFDKAVGAGHGFTGGTIVFEDKDYQIFNFLLDYAQKANTALSKNKQDAKYISQNCLAYERHSSHFPEMKKNFQQFGIDIRYGKGELQKLLPTNKSHILFGKVAAADKNLTFLKMEMFGLCMKDASVVKHGLNFLKGTKDKKGASRREDLPKEVTKKLDALLQALPKKSDRLALNQEIGKPAVIKNIYPAVKKLAAQKGIPGSNEAQILVNYLEDNFNHLSIRRGNEVILVPLLP